MLVSIRRLRRLLDHREVRPPEGETTGKGNYPPIGNAPNAAVFVSVTGSPPTTVVAVTVASPGSIDAARVFSDTATDLPGATPRNVFDPNDVSITTSAATVVLFVAYTDMYTFLPRVRGVASTSRVPYSTSTNGRITACDGP